MAAWNVTICSSASSLLKMNSKNRVEQVLGMVPSPQVSPSTIRGASGELYNIGPNGEAAQAGGRGLSPKRGYYAAFAEQMADEEMVVEEEEIMGGAGGVVLKKRRLSVDQVRFLESSFESENKLEPDRKVQIAQRLGLQPRQVAVWFQNRRARSKSKQLERDFLALKANYHAVLLENEKLQAEVDRLTAQLREGSVPFEEGHTEGTKQLETKTSGSSSNCANSEEFKLKMEGPEDHVHEASTASGNELGGDTGGEEQVSSPCTILADVNVNVNVSAAVVPFGHVRGAKVAADQMMSAAASYEALVSEDIQFLTNCMQQAYAHQLVDLYTDALHFDNNLFITSTLDDPWSDS
ncbi:hypothetical protein GOP47_0002900 [Adiantum capillus-veneris]|uniref:Homeobox domain-containing protein n=1 Tax=Adiantum capillus-veneris TaxID=13818 RepID=A0A9D4VCY3_ADICA|nr:hypothetical protein GOP47_0002900 [Adiantum capillus-veneris]